MRRRQSLSKCAAVCAFIITHLAAGAAAAPPGTPEFIKLVHMEKESNAPIFYCIVGDSGARLATAVRGVLTRTRPRSTSGTTMIVSTTTRSRASRSRERRLDSYACNDIRSDLNGRVPWDHSNAVALARYWAANRTTRASAPSPASRRLSSQQHLADVPTDPR